MCLYLWNLYKEYCLEDSECKLNFLNFNLSLITIKTQTNKPASSFYCCVTYRPFLQEKTNYALMKIVHLIYNAVG